MDSEWCSNCIPWSPGVQDTGQVDEYSRDGALFVRECANSSEDDVCLRAFRAIEIERVMAELWHAMAVLTRGELQVDNPRIEWFASTVATLNLMGIDTVLPGEGSLAAVEADADHALVNLAPSDGDTVNVDVRDRLDALGGLIREFNRSTIFRNGLGLASSPGPDGLERWSLTATHQGIISAFGDFLMGKYINEGWQLV